MDGNLLLAVWFALLLGMQHGLDPDHLATIDGMARQNLEKNSRLARRSGLWFALGHGTVVTMVAAVAASVRDAWQVPDYFETLGAWISILFLLALGILNGTALLYAPARQRWPIAGINARLAGRFRVSHPMAIALTGALFALSFDTLSQAALFAAAYRTGSNTLYALALGASFTLGMLLTDTLNGWWSAYLMLRANRDAAVLSRMMGGMVAILSLLVATLGALRLCYPETAAKVGYAAPVLGGLIILMPLMVYSLGWLWLRHRRGLHRA